MMHARFARSRAVHRESPTERARPGRTSTANGRSDRPGCTTALREVLEAAGLGRASGRSAMETGRGRRAVGLASGWRPGWIAGSSLAASILALLIVLPAVVAQQADAQAMIRANAAPLAALVGPPAPSRGGGAGDSDPEDDRGIPARQLAQAEPIRPPAEPTPAADATVGHQDRGAVAVRF